MKAVLLKAFGGTENLADGEISEPEPKEGEVKIRSRMISVNPTDYKARSGSSGGALPMIMGRDTAGIVEAVGPGVSAFSPGDEVMAYLPRFGESGGEGYAEFVCVPIGVCGDKARRIFLSQRRRPFHWWRSQPMNAS